jgi:hypothetical protein
MRFGDLLAALAERRHVDGDLREPIVQVVAECFHLCRRTSQAPIDSLVSGTVHHSPAARAHPELHQRGARGLRPGAQTGEGLDAKQPEQSPFIPKRIRALDMTADEFEKDTAAQDEFFKAAQTVRDRMDAFAKKILKDLGIQNGTAESILKRDGKADFVKGVLNKVRGRKYAKLGQMTDAVRGRFNVDDPKDVKRIVEALQGRPDEQTPDFRRPQVTSVTDPKPRSGVDNGYPRFHVDVKDPETSIVHEWQIGTKQTTALFETPGIYVGPLEAKIESKNRNIHDIEYDIFKSIDEPSPKQFSPAEQAELRKLSEDCGIPEFRKHVAELAARTGSERIPDTELDAKIHTLLTRASEILKALIAKKGGDPRGTQFVASFLH